MTKGRLGSFESEHNVQMQFLGWLGQEEAGGGVQSLQQELEAQGDSAQDMREQFVESEITSDDLSTSSGAANVPHSRAYIRNRVPANFLAQHPGLKRFLKSKYPVMKPSPGLAGLGEAPSFKKIAMVGGLVVAVGIGYHLLKG